MHFSLVGLKLFELHWVMVANREFPSGTVLLRRYGEITYEVKDIVQREGEWQPPGIYEADRMERYRSFPEATVKIVSEGLGAIPWVVIFQFWSKQKFHFSIITSPVTWKWIGFSKRHKDTQNMKNNSITMLVGFEFILVKDWRKKKRWASLFNDT